MLIDLKGGLIYLKSGSYFTVMPNYKKLALILIPAILIGVIITSVVIAGILPPSFEWEESTPEEESVDPTKLSDMIAEINSNAKYRVDNVIVVKNGKIILEEYFNAYSANTNDAVYSVTKSVISLLVGIAINKGYINSVEDLVLEYFNDLTIENSTPQKQLITLEDLLTMRSGLLFSTSDDINEILNLKMLTKPKLFFEYSDAVAHIVSHIITRATGMKTQDFAYAYLFQPLGITDYYWLEDGDGVAKGGWGLSLTPRDMAKIGQLCLQNGTWEGNRIVSSSWVQYSTSNIVSNEEVGNGKMEYGYFWWVLKEMGFYCALGYEDHAIYIIPEQQLVAVFNCDHLDNYYSINIFIEYILSALY